MLVRASEKHEIFLQKEVQNFVKRSNTSSAIFSPKERIISPP